MLVAKILSLDIEQRQEQISIGEYHELTEKEGRYYLVYEHSFLGERHILLSIDQIEIVNLESEEYSAVYRWEVKGAVVSLKSGKEWIDTYIVIARDFKGATFAFKEKIKKNKKSLIKMISHKLLGVEFIVDSNGETIEGSAKKLFEEKIKKLKAA